MLSKSVATEKYYWHGEEITKEQYNHILSIIRNRPIAPTGFSYRLTAELEWELCELPEPESEEEISDSEALAIITGGVTDA